MTRLRHSMPLNAQIRAEATEWLIRFSEDEADVTACEHFNSWLRMSPEHVRAYLRVSALLKEGDGIAAKGTPRDIDALVARAKLEGNIYALDGGQHITARDVADTQTHIESVNTVVKRGTYARRRTWRPAFALAATVLLALGIGTATWYIGYHAPTYVTDIGERRIVNLPDGSSVVINARSRIKVRYTEAERLIELREGQALFKVATNAARPFTVRSGDTSIRAVGTQFDVYKKDTGTVITVVEGKVVVSPLPIRLETLLPLDLSTMSIPALVLAGEQAVVTKEAARKMPAPHIESATAWTLGLLVFDGTPLGEVVREFNRQNAKPLVIDDAELADLTISGTFPADGSERITRFVQERFKLTVSETDEEIRISRRPGPVDAEI